MKVVQIATAQDVGRSLNPLALLGQIEGGMAGRNADVAGAGKIGAKVEDRAPAAAGSSAQLKVSKSEEGARPGAAGGEKSVARLQELVAGRNGLVLKDKR